jgi:hypothetical protein
MTTVVAPPSNAIKWQMGFNPAFEGLICRVLVSFVWLEACCSLISFTLVSLS